MTFYLNFERKKLVKIQNHRPTIILANSVMYQGQKKIEKKMGQEIENQVNCAPEVGVASFITPLPIA